MAYRVLIIFLAAITFFGCAPKPVMREIRPAKLDWEDVHNVALLKFDGPEGDRVRLRVYKRLNAVLYLRVLDLIGRAVFDEITYDTVQGTKSVRISREVAGDLLLVGRATGVVDDVQGMDQAEVKEGTGYFKKEKNLEGEWVDVEIMRTVIRSLPYVIRHASLTTDYMVFGCRTGELIARGTVSEVQDKKFGGIRPDSDLEYQPAEAPPQDTSLDELSTRVARKLVAEISRMKATATIQLDKGHDRLVRRGVVMAKRGDWEHAVEYWNDAIDKEPNNAAAHYNLGVTHEALGDLKALSAARNLYQKAASLGDNPLYADGVARVNRIIEENMKE